MAFGLGPHYCLGAPLARLEAQVVLPLVIERFPALRMLQERPAWRKNPTFLGLESLPLVFA
nr:cytochrome P450 [Dictyobacter vulcani]